uniref:Uncharacterized protein n=1 Tax=viral metagenome TaxID=1070528 RepID=A0A6M3KN54_9ZZZZ
MSQQVIIDRDLIFRGAALYQPNVKGPMMTEYKIFDEQFVIATTNDWNEEETNGGTIAAAAVDGGAMTLTCGSTANDCAELSHTAQWSAASACGMEAKAKISAITNVCVAIGFVDAKEATNDHIAGEITDAALRDPTVTADAALFVFDTNQTTDVWYVGAINNNTIGTPVAAKGTLIPVANTYFKVRIQTDKVGNVTFYYNGVAVGYLPSAIAYASTNLLTPYVGIISRSTGAAVCTVSRITTWQEN